MGLPQASEGSGARASKCLPEGFQGPPSLQGLRGPQGLEGGPGFGWLPHIVVGPGTGGYGLSRPGWKFRVRVRVKGVGLRI